MGRLSGAVSAERLLGLTHDDRAMLLDVGRERVVRTWTIPNLDRFDVRASASGDTLARSERGADSSRSSGSISRTERSRRCRSSARRRGRRAALDEELREQSSGLLRAEFDRTPDAERQAAVRAELIRRWATERSEPDEESPPGVAGTG